jgi:hypothetical protein
MFQGLRIPGPPDRAGRALSEPGFEKYASHSAHRPTAEAVKPARWTWESVGEKFGEWWARQDIKLRNVSLRSMNIPLEFEHEHVRLDLGGAFGLTQQMEASGPVAAWQQVLTAMRGNDIAGMEITGDNFQLTRTEHDRCLAANTAEWLIAIDAHADTNRRRSCGGDGTSQRGRQGRGHRPRGRSRLGRGD